MGLDMWLYRVTRLDEQEKNDIATMSMEELKNKFNVRQWDERDDTLLAQIKPFITFIERPVEQIDLDLAKKACGIPEDAEYHGQIMNSNVWFFSREGDDNDYTIDYWKCSEEQRRQMTVTNMLTFGIYHREEIWYWRKNYKLRKNLYKASDVPMENCGYYTLNDKMNECICKAIKDDNDFINKGQLEPTEDSVVCYHEWY